MAHTQRWVAAGAGGTNGEFFALAPPLTDAAEDQGPAVNAHNPTFELTQTRFALDMAIRWRKRMRLPPMQEWGEVLGSLAPPPLATMAPLAAAFDSRGDALHLGTPLAAGGHYLHVCAEDRLRLLACAPPYAFTVDLTPPTCDPIADSAGGVPIVGAYFATAGALSATWSCVDPESSVARVEWQVYDGAGTPLLPRARAPASRARPPGRAPPRGRAPWSGSHSPPPASRRSAHA